MVTFNRIPKIFAPRMEDHLQQLSKAPVVVHILVNTLNINLF